MIELFLESDGRRKQELPMQRKNSNPSHGRHAMAIAWRKPKKRVLIAACGGIPERARPIMGRGRCAVLDARRALVDMATVYE